MVRGFSSLLVALLLAACASTAKEAARPPGSDLAGTYAFSTFVDGSPVEGQMRITGSPGDWGGSIWSELTGELPFSSVTVAGQQMRLTADTANGPVDVRLVFDGDTFTGDWSLGASGGAIHGRRVDT